MWAARVFGAWRPAAARLTAALGGKSTALAVPMASAAAEGRSAWALGVATVLGVSVSTVALAEHSEAVNIPDPALLEVGLCLCVRTR